MFRNLTSGVALLMALAMSLSGLVFSPVQASVPVPANGLYSCTTGGPAASGNRYQINFGQVIIGSSCAGAVVITEGVTHIGAGAFQSATALTSITIPSSVTNIEQNAFLSATALTSITIPSSVTSIGRYAFNGATALTSITFAPGSKLTDIGTSAFSGATALTSITIPEGVTAISSALFNSATALTSVTIPSTVTSIGSVVFANATSLSSISVASNSQSFTSINGVLFNKNKTELLIFPAGKSEMLYIIPSSVTSIGSYAFAKSSLTSITIPSSVTSIGNSAFSDATALTSVTFAQGSQLTFIEEAVFNRATSLSSITIPPSVTAIGEYAFKQTALTSITIPSSVTSIFYAAFKDARSLRDVNFLGNAPGLDDDVFLGVATGAKAHIKTDATGFGTPGSGTWNGLIVQADLHEVTYNVGSGSAVSSGIFIEGDSIQTAPVSTRAGYTLSGWSTTTNGGVVTFPYAPDVTTDITLHAIWTPTKTPTKTLTKTAVISSAVMFPAGSSVITQSTKSAMAKLVSKSGKSATYTVTGVATKSTGVPDSYVKALAKARAEKVKAYLVKLGVKKSSISITIKIVNSGITPKTNILAKYSTK